MTSANIAVAADTGGKASAGGASSSNGSSTIASNRSTKPKSTFLAKFLNTKRTIEPTPPPPPECPLNDEFLAEFSTSYQQSFGLSKSARKRLRTSTDSTQQQQANGNGDADNNNNGYDSASSKSSEDGEAVVHG
jgi:hypothetical protein